MRARFAFAPLPLEAVGVLFASKAGVRAVSKSIVVDRDSFGDDLNGVDTGVEGGVLGDGKSTPLLFG